MFFFFFFFFHCSNYLNVGTNKKTSAENLLLVGSSLSEVIEMIFKIQFINHITCSITTGVSVGGYIGCTRSFCFYENPFLNSSFLVPSLM